MNWRVAADIRERSELYLTTWKFDNRAQLGTLSWTDERAAIRVAEAECAERARSEVQAEEDERNRADLGQVWDNPLTPHVTEFFEQSAERQRLEAERDAKIHAIQAEYGATIPRPGDEIDRYNEGRARLLLERVAAAGLELCYDCQTAKPDTKLVYLDGQHQRGTSDCSYSTATWTEQYHWLRRLCQPCQDHWSKPMTDRQLSENPNITYCFVRPVEIQNGRFVTQIDDESVILSDALKPDEREYARQSGISERLARQWNIPPELDYRGGTTLSIYRSMEDNLPVKEPDVQPVS